MRRRQSISRKSNPRHHRILKEEKLKIVSTEVEMDPEAAKENAMKQEFKRAEERMTLKHKNRSKWAKRILKRGLSVQDEGTRAAITEQLNQHALLTRKMNSVRDTSSSDETSDDDDNAEDEPIPEKEKELASKLLNRAKERTLKVLEDRDELPKNSFLKLPFMERGLKMQQEEAKHAAQIALEEYDASLRQLENENNVEGPESAKESGRRVFGPPKDKPQKSQKRKESYGLSKNSDSEDDFETEDQMDVGQDVNDQSHDLNIGAAFHDEPRDEHHSVFKSFDDNGNPIDSGKQQKSKSIREIQMMETQLPQPDNFRRELRLNLNNKVKT